jgi:hypothetical protein
MHQNNPRTIYNPITIDRKNLTIMEVAFPDLKKDHTYAEQIPVSSLIINH